MHMCFGDVEWGASARASASVFDACRQTQARSEQYIMRARLSFSTRELSARAVFHSKKIAISESTDQWFNEHAICVSSGINVADVVVEEVLSTAATLAAKKACDGVDPDFSGWAKVISIRPKTEVLDAQIAMALCPNRDATEQSAAVELQRRFIALAAKSVFDPKWPTAAEERNSW